MQTVHETTCPSKPESRCYYTIYHDRHGVLGKLDVEILFLDDEDESIAVIEPPDFPWIAILGEIGLCDTQAILDRIHGGFAQIACSRPN